mgnify:CR=1 FL=1
MEKFKWFGNQWQTKLAKTRDRTKIRNYTATESLKIYRKSERHICFSIDLRYTYVDAIKICGILFFGTLSISQ